MKHTLHQLVIHLRKVAEVLKREFKILWDRVEWMMTT